jgi:LacI family transcriptional regulator
VPHRARRVAIFVETSNAYARGLLDGLSRYMAEHGRWSIYWHEHAREDDAPAWLARWNGDGIIARIESPRTARIVLESGLPAVNVSRPHHARGVPCVETDDEAIARLAAEHLIERQFRSFGFCGFSDHEGSRIRVRHFKRFVEAAGGICSVFEVPKRDMHGAGWEKLQAETAEWLKALPKPAGVMACYDVRGRQTLDACRAAEIAVPDQVAVVGVDDDEILCRLADPPLSSVAPDTRRTGYLAAARLDALMSGRDTGPETLLVAPLGVVTRRSTDIFATDDALVAKAARFIRDHACKRINVEEVIRHVGVSRRVLEQRFRAIVGQSPHAQITRVRIDEVKRLLLHTKLSLGEIASRTGFEHVEYMSTVFKRKVGQTLGRYRIEPVDVLRSG